MIFNPEDIVCVCHNVKKKAIKESILINGAKTVEDVGKFTKAGIVCGGCQWDIEDILEETLWRN
jgi:bacterioferritin-associated ferredoxin